MFLSSYFLCLVFFFFFCFHSLSTQMVEGSIRCFVSLVDRFTRRGHNTDLLTSKGLLTILIGCLRTTPPKGTIGTNVGQKSPVLLTSTIINLLVIFCRRSRTATEVCICFVW